MKPLVIPPAAQRDANAVQMLGAWIAEQGLHCSLNIGMWQENGTDERRAWGILLADTVRHIANAMREQYGHPVPDTIAGIIQALNAELEMPTSATEGGFSAGPH